MLDEISLGLNLIGKVYLESVKNRSQKQNAKIQGLQRFLKRHVDMTFETVISIQKGIRGLTDHSEDRSAFSKSAKYEKFGTDTNQMDVGKGKKIPPKFINRFNFISKIYLE